MQYWIHRRNEDGTIESMVKEFDGVPDWSALAADGYVDAPWKCAPEFYPHALRNPLAGKHELMRLVNEGIAGDAAGDERDALIVRGAELGLKFDRRWSTERMRHEIAAASENAE